MNYLIEGKILIVKHLQNLCWIQTYNKFNAIAIDGNSIFIVSWSGSSSRINEF